jgi:hypothetical protein
MAPAAGGQTCQSAADMDAATRTALETSGKRYFDMAARGDTVALQQSSIPAISASFSGIEAAVKDNQAVFSGAQATVRPPYFLTADGNEPLARAEFLCGVFGKLGQTADSAVFVLNNLPPGKYGLVILDVKGSLDSRTLTLIVQPFGPDWKLAGFYAKQAQLGGHDGPWFAQRAREFKTKGQNRNAWLYYHQAIALTSPVDFMSTLNTDRLYDEAQSIQPSDLPANGTPIPLTTVVGDSQNVVVQHQQPKAETEQYIVAKAGNTVMMTSVFPLAVGNDLDVVVKYQADDVSDTGKTFQENVAVIKGLLAKFPEFRDAFAGVVARAVEPTGRDYGSLLLMKDIK